MKKPRNPVRSAPVPGSTVVVKRGDPFVRAVAASWRRLTTPRESARAGPGEKTVIACSGGADSTALAIALTAAAGRHAPDRLRLVHVVHDLRPRGDAMADADAVAALAQRLGVPFVRRAISVRGEAGNLEANARRARYAALAAVAREHGVRFIATAHHAHDQMESILMALLRGSGPRGLAGIRSSRPLERGLVLIRPMLGVEPDAARTFCDRTGVTWREDATNADRSRTRNRLRAEIVPLLVAMRPPGVAAARFADAALIVGQASDWVDRNAKRRIKSCGKRWSRAECRRMHAALLSAMIRCVIGPTDRVGARQIGAVVRFIQSNATDPKSFGWRGHTVRVTASHVEIEPVPR